MKEREIKLLEYLISHDDYHTASFLATRFNCSVRSIKSYISSINEEASRTILSSHEGFKINDKEKALELLENSNGDIPQNAEKRQKYILRKLLIEQSSIDLDDLANEMCISPATLNNELSAVKLSLTQYDLVFRTKNNIASIEGSEENKKKMISRTIYDESVDGFMSLELAQSYFPEYDLNFLKRCVNNTLIDHMCFMDDFSLLNFLLHLVINMQRSSSFCTKEEISREQDIIVNAHVKDIIIDITNEIERKYDIRFSSNDIYDLSVLMMTRILKNNANNLTADHLETIVGKEVFDLFYTIHDRVKNTFSITIDSDGSDDFKIRFCLHLKNMLFRLENGIDIRNPQMLQIKNQYPFIYDVSVYISNIIKEEKGLQLSEDEIAYIALHIGVLIEEKNAVRSKISVLFLCPQYFYKKGNVVDKCMSVFENDILSVGVITSYNELADYKNYDTIISTIPFRNESTIPVTMVSTYFTNKDILSVSNMIEEVHHNKAVKNMSDKLTQLFKKEFFYINEDFHNEKEAIDRMTKDLEKEGYINADFRTKTFEREKVASSAYGNIAMPHPMEMCANRSVISVSIHPNPIKWNFNRVNIVFMLAISDDLRSLFAEVFDFVTEIISNEELLVELINVTSYEEFIQYMLKLCR
ncbi:MAG: PTS sugar transporter subunit IIA [Erysipelotrichaceae bacterium]|nr:PTS sugar transporter subunit IIA [Erysipelotrichaceae bacterium]